MTIEAKDCAVVFLDHQDNLVDLAKTVAPERVRSVAGALAQITAACHLPAFASVVPFGVDNPKPIAAISSILPDLPYLPRGGASAWRHETSREAIRHLRRPHLAVCGVFSEIVVRHTAGDLLQAGFAVTVLADACAGFEQRSEQAAWQELRSLGAKVSTVPTFGSSFVDTWDTPVGQALGGAIASLLQ